MAKLTTAQLTHYGLLGAKSARQPKIVTKANNTYKESSEQGTIARYIKLQHPSLPFITIERGGFIYQSIKLLNTFLASINS